MNTAAQCSPSEDQPNRREPARGAGGGVHVIVVNSDADRDRALRWVWAAPEGMRIEFRERRRSSSQNKRMWAMLADISEQADWHGHKPRPDQWKVLFIDALGGELLVVPNMDGNGIVSLGRRSSELTKQEMSGMIELMHKFGAERGVVFGDERGGT